MTPTDQEQLLSLMNRHPVLTWILIIFIGCWISATITVPFAIHSIAGRLGRIADALEKISKK